LLRHGIDVAQVVADGEHDCLLLAVRVRKTGKSPSYLIYSI
jgi:hypothetical protein